MAGTFFVLQNRIEARAVAVIKEDLQTTRELVINLIEERSRRLTGLALAAGSNELVRTIVTDATLDRLTSDDIVATEIMPSFPHLSLLSIADHKGQIRGSHSLGPDIEKILSTDSPLKAGLSGRVGHAFIRHGDRYHQIITFPLLIGPPSRNEVLGSIFVGMEWSAEDLQKIRTMSRADIALLHGLEILIFEGAAFKRSAAERQALSEATIDRLSSTLPEIHRIAGERYLFLKIEGQQARGAPSFVIAKSLDAQLGFVDDIRRVMVQFALLGIAVGLAVSLVMALGIARPIRTLTAVARLIAQDNYGMTVRVRTRDEFAQLGEAFNQMIAGLRERDLIRNTFGRYVDREVAQRLLSRPESLHLGGQKRQVVILMADIRGFSRLSEQITPEATILLLNHYFARMIAIIKGHEGIVVDFIGDGLLAFFDPLATDVSKAALSALNCAFQMQAELAGVNATMASDGLPDLAIGIGLNTGPAIVGNIGSMDRAKYGIVGAEVNLTQRIQGEARPGEVILSEPMLNLVDGVVQVQRRFEQVLKGFSGQRSLFAVAPREVRAATPVYQTP
ncbi:MAG: adenylate/guanylate cyclase domain-containing protein [Desulfobacteraceae bacterium]|nr:MAG: adenylate/guanylate cyclase domain-containing protein [Desulfobacteraceae bacterium]